MNIESKRHLDYWIGTPLCFFVSIFHSVCSIFCKAKLADKHPHPKFLFIKATEMGAIVLMYPLFKQIKREYPDAEFYFLTFDKNEEIFELFDGIVPRENILTIREQKAWMFGLDTFRMMRRIRKENINVTFDLEFYSRYTALLTYFSKAKKRIGFYRFNFEGLYRGRLLTHKVRYNHLIHMSETFMSLLQVIKKDQKNTPELGEAIDKKKITLPILKSNRQVNQRISNRLVEYGVGESSRIILINPGEGTLPLREWSLENFISLSKKLLLDPDYVVILVGSKGLSQKDEFLSSALNSDRCINLVGQTSLVELIELFHVSEALIVNDCGLAHMASLTSIKKFVIFGPESPQIFSPLGDNTWIIHAGLPCSPCLSVYNHRKSACTHNQCLKVITPDYIYNLVMNNIGRSLKKFSSEQYVNALSD